MSGRGRAGLRRTFAAGCLLAGACASDAAKGGPAGQGEAAVVDDRGRALSADSTRRRIVSLIPSVTETLVALGASGRLAARTEYDLQPELAGLPSVGGGLDPSLEFLAQLDPGLVVLWPGAGGASTLEERLDDLGVETYAAAVHTTADFRRLTRNLGRLLGLERAADSALAAVDAQLDEARLSWAGRRPVAAMYVVSRAPVVTAGGGTFVDSIMAAAGAANVFGDLDGGWPRVSLEEVVWRDPRYLIVPVAAGGGADGSAGAAAVAAGFAAEAGWAEAPAVLAGRILLVDADLFGRPGPRMGEAALRLARRLR